LSENAIDAGVHRHSLNDSVRAMLFSDCAFLESGNSLLAEVAATELIGAALLVSFC
jgi:hypothetical protein